MEQKNTRLRNVGFITFFFSGICAISSGVFGVDVFRLRGEYDVGIVLFAFFGVGFKLPRILVVILVRAKLRRIDKNRYDNHIGEFVRLVDKAKMAGVECAHSRDKGDFFTFRFYFCGKFLHFFWRTYYFH